MNVSLAQTIIDWENRNANLANATNMISAYRNTDVMLFPEMSFTGFSMNTSATADSDFVALNTMGRLARSFDISIGFGWVRESSTEGLCENVYTILNRDGSILSEYVKIHPFSYVGEDKRFRGGDRISAFYLDKTPFSVFTCYDLRFPELFRAVVEEIHAVIIPACWPAKRAEHWKTLLKARAIENQIYVLAINCVGNIGGVYYSGDSCVVNPDGKIIEMLSDKEGVISFDFKDDVVEYRTLFPVLNDIRPISKEYLCEK